MYIAVLLFKFVYLVKIHMYIVNRSHDSSWLFVVMGKQYQETKTFEVDQYESRVLPQLSNSNS